MRPFLAKFEERKQEMEVYFHFVQTTEIDIDEKKHLLRTEEEAFKLVKVLKANCFLMLYNVVEGSITEAIDAIFEAISIQKVGFKRLIPAYQKIWLVYQHGLLKITAESAKAKDPTKNKIGKSISQVLAQLEYFKIEPFKDKDYNIYQNYKGYLKVVDAVDLSGNLDAKKMRELAEKYAFSVPERCDELLKIKQIRNQLAHGEIIFSEVGAISMTELMNIKQKVFDYLESILLNINDFITEDRFMIKL
jgi:MAE_28990/MAE_18760-like HEPN